MNKSLQLLSISALALVAVILVPFEQAEEFLAANFFSTEAEAPMLPAAPKVVEAPVKVDIFANGMDEFVLVENQKGTESYTIPQNTCRNGVRVIVRSDITVGNMSAELHVFGFSRRSSRETYNSVLTVTKDDAVKVAHLPSELVYNNDTLFPEYEIRKSRNAESLRYDVMCY